jgi:hypothetical protein
MPSPRFRGKSPLGLYGDVVEELDWSVGVVLAKLKKEGLDNQTLVMFSSDNGPWYQGSPGQLRGRKGSTYEGGVREPFIGARDQLYVLPGQSRTSIVWIVGLLGVRQGIHGRLFPVLPSTEWAIVAVLTLRTAALTKARLEDGKYRADFWQ